MNQTSASFNAALQVAQHTVSLLAKWADAQLAHKFDESNVNDAIKNAPEILSWPQECDMKPLRLLFDRVKLDRGQDKEYYWQPKAIEDKHPTIPYPQQKQQNDDLSQKTHQEIAELKSEIKKALNLLRDEDWKNLSLLTLIIEKFGSFISFGDCDVALVDIAKTTAAVAAALANNPHATELSLIAGDLSGIQNFIYTISSEGALKSLRARSFYLELVTEEIVQQLLVQLNLPRTNVIYAGGGNLYILADATDASKTAINKVRQQFNEWLLDEFQGKVFLALDCLTFPIDKIQKAEGEEAEIKKIADYWSDVTKQLSTKHKSRKFAAHIDKFLQPSYAHQPCRVCHRDDVENLKPLNEEEADSVLACDTCCSMSELGGRLFGVEAIVRSQRESAIGAVHTILFKFKETAESPAVNIYYHLFKNWKQIVPDSDTIFLINDWTLEHYQFKHFRNVLPLLLGNYGRRNPEQAEDTEEPLGFMRAGEMAKQAKGITRLGYLQMDVDRLGQIFAKGLNNYQTLPRIAGLSRQISYFFKVYLNSLAEARNANIPNEIKQLSPDDERLDLVFIYAGGDDLFVIGAWNQVVEFAFDVYQSFRAYTGYHPDITLSGGISIADFKFPLYLAAREAKKAEEAAKGNGKDSLGLFYQVFKWDEWLGIKDIKLIDSEIKKYLQSENKPEMLGVFPFVERLEQQDIGVNYSRNFVRNLLITAQLQEEALKKLKDKQSKEALGTRYYLHLPKIAYTLARLPKGVLNDDDFRTSLKSPYNAPYFRAIATWIELLTRA